MKKYQNVLAGRDKSTFVDVANRDNSELTFTSKTAVMRNNGAQAQVVAGSVTVTKPKAVANCATECEAFRFTESVSIRFNVEQFDTTSLDALKAEVDRVFLLVKQNLSGGILPAISDTFVDE